MKKLLKFFPVAVAAVALASCSNDELFLGAENEPQKDPTKLYAQIEDLTDGETGEVTRSGFVYSYDANIPNGQVFVWTEGDKVKLYDDLNNWRPQIWTYDEAATIAYAQSGDKFGFAVFESNTTEDDLTDVVKARDDKGQLLPQYKNAYGVMPYDLAEFANENRTAIKFDFSKLAYYKTELNDETANTTNNLKYAPAKLSKAPIPLWAVANGQEMKVNYLTGILKVDIDNIANLPGTVDGNANTHQFLIIQSKADATDGFYMHPTAKQVPALAEVAFTPDVAGAAPAVSSTTTGVAATNLTAVEMATTSLSSIPADLIVVDLGDVAEGRVQVSVPLLPGKQNVQAFVKKNVDISTLTSVNLQTPDAIADAKEFTVAAAKYYRIQDPGLVKISTLNNPYSVAQYIISQDPKQTRDWTLQLEADVDVKTGGAGADVNNYVLDLSSYGLKHNVTIEFAPTFGLKQNVATDKLVVKTANSEKTLTIVGTTNSTLQNIEIDAAAAGKIVMKGDLKNITNKANNVLTVVDAQSSQTSVYTSGIMTFDAYNKTLKTMNVQNGCQKVNIANGKVNNIYWGTSTDKFTGTTEVYITGSGYVAAANYAYVKTKGTGTSTEFDANIKFTSKLTMAVGTGKYATDATELQNAKMCLDPSAKYVITSAQQLAKCTSASAILAQEIDLAGTDGRIWSPIDSKPLMGYTCIIPTSSSFQGSSDYVNCTIKNVKINAAANAGLFSTLKNDVSHLTLKDFTIEGAATDVVAGALAGTVNHTDDVTIEQVALEGITINVTSKKKLTVSGPAQSIGGLIGKAQISTTKSIILKDIDLKGAVALTGNAALGGIVGSVYGAGKLTFGGMDGDRKGANLAKFTTAPTLTPTASLTEYDPTYAMIGNYVGYADSDVEIYTADKVSAFTLLAPVTTTFDAKAQWGVTTAGATDYYPIIRKTSMVGFSFYNLSSNVPVTTAKTVKVFGYEGTATAFSTTTPAAAETITLSPSIKKTPAADTQLAKTLVTIQYED